MTGIRQAVALAAVALALACGGETGIIAEVQIDQAFASPPDVDRLEFAIAVFDEDGYRSEEDDSFHIDARVGSRDLRWDPYRLYVKSGTDEDHVMVIAVAYGEVEGQPDRVPTMAGRFAMPVPFADGEVRLYPLFLEPVGQNDVTVVGETCVTWLQEGIRHAAGDPPDTDVDCDGAANADDCAPENAAIGARDPTCVDGDGDGYTPCGIVESDGCVSDPTKRDCDDARAGVFPENPAGEGAVCDGLDNDCSGVCDEGFDLDGDGYTDCVDATPNDASMCRADCAPEDPDVFPGAPLDCYGSGPSGCSVGTTACVSELGTFGLDTCTPANLTFVPAQLCDLWTACRGSSESLHCWKTVNEPSVASDGHYECIYPFRQSDGVPCNLIAQPVFTIQGDGGCAVDHVEETEDGYSVDIMTSGCMVFLKVQSGAAGNSDFVTVVYQSASTPLDWTIVKIVPTLVADCATFDPEPCTHVPFP